MIKALDELEARLPQMIKDNPDPGDFWAAFAGQADVIEDQAGEQASMVRGRISDMLASQGCAITTGESLED